MTTISLKRGSTLSILATASSAGEVVVLDETYTVASALAPETSEGPGVDLTTTITEEGKIQITYDTVDLCPGRYHMDIRVAGPTAAEEWTEDLTVILLEPVTKPSARP